MKAEDIIKEVKRLAKANPDNTYNKRSKSDGCMYLQGMCSNGTKGCIVGQGILNLDPNKKDLLEEADLSFCQGDAGAIMTEVNEKTKEKHRQWLNKVQESQDGGINWKDCIKLANQEKKEQNET